MECAIGGLQKCAKFIRSGDTFGGCWLLLILMMLQYKSMAGQKLFSKYNTFLFPPYRSIIYMYSFYYARHRTTNIQQQEEGAVAKTGLPTTVLGLHQDHIYSQKLPYDCKYSEIYID